MLCSSGEGDGSHVTRMHVEKLEGDGSHATRLHLEQLQATVESLQRRMSTLEEEVLVSHGKATTLQEEEHLEVAEPAPGCTAGAGGPAPEAAEEALEEFIDCSLGDTVWDASILLGMPEAGSSGSNALLSLLILLNTFIQVYIVCVLLKDPHFTSTKVFAEMRPDAERWRITVAHQYANMDTSGVSLASRVCGMDASLSQAGAQVDLLDEINRYLGLAPGQFEGGGLGTGPLLCTVCIYFFTVLVLRELRGVAGLLLAVLALPRSRATRIESGRITCVSVARLKAVLLLAAVRTAVALALLCTGLKWLASTSNTADIVLNAAALGFIMELDELLFEAMAPATVKASLQGLEPLRYKRPRCNLDAVLPFVTSIALVASVFFALVLPQAAEMLQVKQALCGNNQDFVITQNTPGLVVARDTLPFDAEGAVAQPSLPQLAVAELRNSAGFRSGMGTRGFNYSLFYGVSSSLHSKADFERMAVMTVQDFGQQMNCEDYDGHQIIQQFPSVFMTIREKIGRLRGVTLAQQAFSCAGEASHYHCATVGLLRSYCPVTCGCDDPRSGLLFATGSMGCPPACLRRRQSAQEGLPCEDAAASDANWTRFWGSLDHMTASMLGEESLYNSFIAGKLARGCADTAKDPMKGTDFCDMEDRHGYADIVGLCPASCCSGPGPRRPHCPRACNSTGTGGAR